MDHKYEAPVAELIRFSSEDVLSNSNPKDDVTEWD